MKGMLQFVLFIIVLCFSHSASGAPCSAGIAIKEAQVSSTGANSISTAHQMPPGFRAGAVLERRVTELWEAAVSVSTSFQVLPVRVMDTSTDTKYWIPTTKDEYPRIIRGGEEKATGETLYVGRGKYKDCLLPGKVYKGADGPGLYVAHGGEEHCIKEYEMLVTTKPMVWVSEHDGGYPLKAIPGGTDSDGNTLYIARARAPDDGVCPGQLYPPHKRCVYSFQGKEHQHHHYDVLAEDD